MKRWIGMLMCLGAGCSTFGQVASNGVEPTVLSELSGIHASLDRIAAELASLRKERRETQDSIPSEEDNGGYATRRASLAKLRAIQLPPQAGHDQIRRYIRDIMEASRGQNTFSDADPQVGMLAQVGSTNMQYLIDALSDGVGCGDYHLEAAMGRLADDSNKSLILRALPMHRNLVKVVVRMGWEADAKGILFTELKNRTEYLPLEWITAVAALRDPASYPLLRDYFIQGPNKFWTYKEIKDLPIADLPKAVDEAWSRSKGGDWCNRLYMAKLAMEFGHKDALEVVITGLSKESSARYGNNGDLRAAVLKLIDFYGSNEELAVWFKRNQDALVFNPDTKKYAVGK